MLPLLQGVDLQHHTTDQERKFEMVALQCEVVDFLHKARSLTCYYSSGIAKWEGKMMFEDVFPY